MKKTGWILSLIVATGLAAAQGEDFTAQAVKALGDVAAYSHKAEFSASVSDVYIGYNAEGKAVSAAALRKIKTYSTVTGLVAVKKADDGQWKISTAQIPDIARIKNAEKQKKVTDAIKAFDGITVRNAEGKVQAVDAVTGATRYQESIYLYFNLLARTAVETAEATLDWPKTPVTK